MLLGESHERRSNRPIAATGGSFHLPKRAKQVPLHRMTTHVFKVSTKLLYDLSQPGWILLNVAVNKSAAQRVVRERLTSNAAAQFREHSVPEGTTRFHGIAAPAGLLEVVYAAEVQRDVADRLDENPVEKSLIDLPPEVIPYLYPSRYCESDKLVRFAAKEFGHLLPGHERVAGICNWLHANIDYQVGITDAHTSAVDCVTLRAGVCRDFAHLGVTLCRAMGIPARYSSVYAYQLIPPDFHAIFEVWLGSDWYYYDATRLAPQHGFLRVGSGHDAADTSVATMSGSVNFVSMEIAVEKVSAERVHYAVGPVSF